MKKWIFVYRDLVSGGNETLILRIASYIKKNGGESLLIYQTMSETMKEQFDQMGVRYVAVLDWSTCSVCDAIPVNCDIIIVFRVTTYFLLKNSKPKGNVILYNVHPYHMTFEDDNRKWRRRIKQVIFKPVIKNDTLSGKIVYMDHETKQAVEKQYGFKISENNILYLPFEETDICKSYTERKGGKVILTICRAEFPFKSYVLGLIDAVKKIHDEGKLIQLNIISYGKDIDMIKERIKGEEYIFLIDELPYSKLEQYYLETDVYVGMGTTVLDAAKYGIPSIVAHSYSPEFMVSGFFHDNPTVCGTSEKKMVGSELLREIIDMENEKIGKEGTLSKDAFNRIYSMQSFVKNIQDIPSKYHSGLEERLCFKLLKRYMILA